MNKQKKETRDNLNQTYVPDDKRRRKENLNKAIRGKYICFAYFRSNKKSMQ